MMMGNMNMRCNFRVFRQLNPNTDFDLDSLTNLEEYQRATGGDFDGDGIPNIYDNDGIPTSVELQYHLDPFNPEDVAGDLDGDGLNNVFEYHHGLKVTAGIAIKQVSQQMPP